MSDSFGGQVRRLPPRQGYRRRPDSARHGRARRYAWRRRETGRWCRSTYVPSRKSVQAITGVGRGARRRRRSGRRVRGVCSKHRLDRSGARQPRQMNGLRPPKHLRRRHENVWSHCAVRTGPYGAKWVGEPPVHPGRAPPPWTTPCSKRSARAVRQMRRPRSARRAAGLGNGSGQKRPA